MADDTRTAGPWKVVHGDNYVIDSRDGVVAQAYAHPDALLIAAAPDLYAACVAALEWTPLDDDRALLVAAIKKAGGNRS